MNESTIAKTTTTDITLIECVSLPLLTTLLQGAGYRTNESEQNGIVQLLSASQGIGFAVRFGNPGPNQGEFMDFTFSCALRIEGELPAALVAQWNQSKRFSRLSEQGGFLVLDMDVVIAGGVTERYLRASTELWDRLLQEFLLYLRAFSAAQASKTELMSGDGLPPDRATAADETPASADLKKQETVPEHYAESAK